MRSLLILVILAAGLMLLGGAFAPEEQKQKHSAEAWSPLNESVVLNPREDAKETRGVAPALATSKVDATQESLGTAGEKVLEKKTKQPETEHPLSDATNKSAGERRAVIDGVPVPKVDEVLNSSNPDLGQKSMAIRTEMTSSRVSRVTSEQVMTLTRENDQMLRHLLEKYSVWQSN